jgi:hypothetical protein
MHIAVFVVNFLRRIYTSYLFGGHFSLFMLFIFAVYALVLSEYNASVFILIRLQSFRAHQRTIILDMKIVISTDD